MQYNATHAADKRWHISLLTVYCCYKPQVKQKPDLSTFTYATRKPIVCIESRIHNEEKKNAYIAIEKKPASDLLSERHRKLKIPVYFWFIEQVSFTMNCRIALYHIYTTSRLIQLTVLNNDISIAPKRSDYIQLVPFLYTLDNTKRLQ